MVSDTMHSTPPYANLWVWTCCNLRTIYLLGEKKRGEERKVWSTKLVYLSKGKRKSKKQQSYRWWLHPSMSLWFALPPLPFATFACAHITHPSLTLAHTCNCSSPCHPCHAGLNPASITPQHPSYTIVHLVLETQFDSKSSPHNHGQIPYIQIFWWVNGVPRYLCSPNPPLLPLPSM